MRWVCWGGLFLCLVLLIPFCLDYHLYKWAIIFTVFMLMLFLADLLQMKEDRLHQEHSGVDEVPDNQA